MIGILTDITKCIGCEKCVRACQKENNCSPERPEHKAKPEELFHTRWTSVIRKPGNHYVRRHCRHCLEPACAAACPVGAMSKTSNGPVAYDKRKCIGCRYCMVACPFGIPRYEWDSLSPGVAKCTLCQSRISKGGEPACTEICPEKATLFGSRDTLLREAGQRLRNNPEKYLLRIFGEHEIGGVSVLYLSPVRLNFSPFKKAAMGNAPLPALSGKALYATPAALGGLCALLTALRFFIDRRMKIRQSTRHKGGHT